MHPVSKTDAAIVAAWAGVVGVVAGALISSVGVAFRELVIGRRERQARAALREAQLKDQRAAFQRDNIIALQDAAGEVSRMATEAYQAALLHEDQHLVFPTWEPGTPPLPPGFEVAADRVEALRARIFDDELRRLATEGIQAEVASFLAPDKEARFNKIGEALENSRELHRRVHTLLKELL